MTAGGDTTTDAGAPDASRVARRSRSKPLIMALVAMAAVFGVVVAVALGQRGQPDPATASTSTADVPPLLRDGGQVEPMPLPDVTLPALDGHGPDGGRDLSDLRGAPVVINFWASWCAPCVEEMPRLQQVGRDMDVKVVGVAYLDQEEKAKAVAERLGITYELLRDDDGEFARDVGLIGTPTTLFVDADGTILRRLTGELTEEQMRETIEAGLL
jgi:cytochrome c biogenesis protein CcmG/thiol:disulfide interchange protein DsbE